MERDVVETWLWVLLTIGAGVVLADVLLRLFTLTVALPIFERRPPFNVRPSMPNPDVELLRIPTADGLTLAGSLYRPFDDPQGLIVFCPEYGGSHWSAPAYAGALVDAGFAVLSFDFRNQGESDAERGYTPTHWLTEREVCDVVAAVDYAASREDLAEVPVGLFGISRGANAALAAGSRLPQARAVAAEGAFSTDAMMLHFAYRWAELYVPAWLVRVLPAWHLAETLRFARRVSGIRHRVRYTVLERGLARLRHRRVLLITGGRDSYVAPSLPERMRQRIGAGCRPVWVVAGAKHNQCRAVATEEYDRRLTAFFCEAMPAAAVPVNSAPPAVISAAPVTYRELAATAL